MPLLMNTVLNVGYTVYNSWQRLNSVNGDARDDKTGLQIVGQIFFVVVAGKRKKV